MTSYQIKILPNNGVYYDEWKKIINVIKNISCTVEIEFLNKIIINKKYNKYRCVKKYYALFDDDYEKWMLSCLHLIKHYPLENIVMKCNLFDDIDENIKEYLLEIGYYIENEFLIMNFKQINDYLSLFVFEDDSN